MSLINEALRKARQAAAEHDDQRSAGRAPQAYPSRGPRKGTGPAAVALVAVLAGLAGAAGVWWIVGAGAVDSDPGGGPPLHQPAAAEGASAPIERQTRLEPAAEALQSPLQTARPVDGIPAPELSTPVPEGTVPEVTTDPTAVPRAEATRVSKSSGTRVFVMDADLGYATLSLGYIVFRPVRPFAEINGVDIYEGSEIAGFKVEKIEIDRVVLRDDRGPLELRVP